MKRRVSCVVSRVRVFPAREKELGEVSVREAADIPAIDREGNACQRCQNAISSPGRIDDTHKRYKLLSDLSRFGQYLLDAVERLF